MKYIVMIGASNGDFRNLSRCSRLKDNRWSLFNEYFVGILFDRMGASPFLCHQILTDLVEGLT